MRNVLAALLLTASAFTAAGAADSPMAAFQAAMAGDDATAKKQAIQALGAKGVGKDDEVYPALVAAIMDRQGGEAAALALQARSGKTPTDGMFRSGGDPAKVQRAWQVWLEDWKQAQKIKKLEKKEDEKKPGTPAAPTAQPAGDAQTTPPEQKAKPTLPPEDLGKLDRVIFKAGGSLLCYVQSKRTDVDGNLLSVRVVHPDGSGEETISADLLSRIEEDVK